MTFHSVIYQKNKKVEPTQALRLARQSKDNLEARTFVPASFMYD